MTEEWTKKQRYIFYLIIKVRHHIVAHLPAEFHTLLLHDSSFTFSFLTEQIQHTHWLSDCFSVNTLRTKSASFEGSKVEGTTRYSPGGRRSLALTSRRLIKVSERAQEEWRRKKSFFKWTLAQPRYWRTEFTLLTKTVGCESSIYSKLDWRLTHLLRDLWRRRNREKTVSKQTDCRWTITRYRVCALVCAYYTSHGPDGGSVGVCGVSWDGSYKVHRWLLMCSRLWGGYYSP